MGLLQWA
jgi:hypothetical protein